MPIESSFNYPSDLNASYPAGTDQKATTDDHLRGIKSVFKTTFPNVSGAVTPTHLQLNYVAGVTSAIQTQLDAKAPLASPALTGTPTAPTAAAGTNTTQVATTAHVFAERTNAATLTNKTLTAPVINSPTGLVKADVGLGNVDNTSDANKPVSTATQAALDLKAPLASPALTGTPTAPTAAAGTSTTQIATTAFVAAQAMSAALPAQTGNSGKFVTTDGTNASWSLVPLSSGVSGTLPVANGGTGATTLTGILKGNGTSAFTAAVAGTDYQSPLVSGTNIKTINSNSLLGSGNLAITAAVTYLGAVTAASSATVDIETTFSSTYDAYIIVASGVVTATDNVQLRARLKVGGAYDTGANYKWHTDASASSGDTYIGRSSTGSGANTYIEVTGLSVGNVAGEAAQLTMLVYNPASTSLQKQLEWSGAYVNSSGEAVKLKGSGLNASTSALTGVRIYASSGNIASGAFRLYGISNS